MTKLRTSLAAFLLVGGPIACKDKPSLVPDAAIPAGHVSGALANLPTPPSGEITGELKVTEVVKDKIAAGDTIFVMARNAATGSLIAAVKVQVGASFPLPFKLTGSDVMHSQTSLAGRVKVEARVDKDKDAMTKNPGDVVGEAQGLVSIPATGVTVTFDKVL